MKIASYLLSLAIISFLFGTISFAQGLVWSVPGPAAQTVSIKDGVYTASHLNTSYTRSHALTDGTVTWQEQSPGMSWHCKASGAAAIFDADVPGTGSNVQRVYVRTPSMLWQFPATVSNTDRFGISTSRDGSRIVAFSDSTLVAFDNGNPTTLDLGFTGLGIDLSADGTTVLVTGDFATRIFAVPSLTVLFSATPSSYTFHAQSISGNGDVFAIGRIGRVDIWRRTNGVYGFDFQHTLPGTNYCDRLDVSDNGSTLAAGFNFFDTNQSVTLDIVDLNTQVLINSATFTGAADLSNIVGDVSVSANGQVIALGMWGDGAGPSPELVFFLRNVTNPIASYSINGSVCDLDLSANGALCVIGKKDIHATASNNTGSIDLYRITRRRR